MAQRKNVKAPTSPRGKTGRRGPIGPQGPAGATGERGVPGADNTGEITTLRGQIDLLVKELQTQLTRIAQLQAQLDHVESGRASEPRNRRSTDRTQH